ncbi:hypothetical protein MKX03_032104, partial [Papaver bracteatum]
MGGSWRSRSSLIVLAIVLCGCLSAFTIAKEEASKLGTVIGIDLAVNPERTIFDVKRLIGR